ncbi:VOC family protein [Vibrio parahaemolyticus]|uniref:VOC family protein n=1 Tax=Vibrio parahaemolyticus TaxID=670 RepID=UPI001DE2C961|nr:VOC family protein [Vibrio parahaemolyticus]MBE4080666.1 glyoxalase/bleomycin resistance/dioxygenase family protein [Vibrio parahaemolyticus]
MKVDRHGIILNVENYDECVSFYRDVFELKVMFTKVEGDFKLTCLEFGDSYLMIETEGHADTNGKSIASCPSKLRFNVQDINDALIRVKQFNLSHEYTENDWGTTINLHDPDGNRVGIRDEVGFVNQMSA